MRIPNKFADKIRAIDVDSAVTVFSYGHWRDSPYTSTALGKCYKEVYKILGDRFTRRDVVRLYQLSDLSADIKFLAAMIWGHEAEENGQRDGRGPWKTSQMLTETVGVRRVLDAIDVSTPIAIAGSYKSLDGALPRCGPNFFTKHLYFMGKARTQRHYPVIFDNRVAAGIARMTGLKESAERMVSITTARSHDAYTKYLSFVHRESDRLGCEPDQLELFLFGSRRT